MSNTTDDRFESEAQVCSACGALLSSESDRGFSFGTENVLCGDCSITRGGRYDTARDAWDPPPDLSDLPDEAYGASPHERRRVRR